MKNSLTRILVVAAVLCAATFALAGEAGTWTGWVTDSHCAEKPDMASNAACAAKCVKDHGAKWVLVNSADKSVWTVSNQDTASKWAGKEVTVKGTADKEKKSIEVSSMEPVGK